MKYLKDELNGAVRKFDETIPKEANRMAVFLEARKYGTNEKGNYEVVGKRWRETTKTEYTKYINSTKEVE